MSSTLLSPLPPPTVTVMLDPAWIPPECPMHSPNVQVPPRPVLPPDFCFVNKSPPPLPSHGHWAWQLLNHPGSDSYSVFFSCCPLSIPLPRPLVPSLPNDLLLPFSSPTQAILHTTGKVSSHNTVLCTWHLKNIQWLPFIYRKKFKLKLTQNRTPEYLTSLMPCSSPSWTPTSDILMGLDFPNVPWFAWLCSSFHLEYHFLHFHMSWF